MLEVKSANIDVILKGQGQVQGGSIARMLLEALLVCPQAPQIEQPPTKELPIVPEPQQQPEETGERPAGRALSMRQCDM